MRPLRLRWVNGGVTAAEGFRAAGISAGIKRSGKPDLALVVGDEPAVAAGVWTTNRVQAAPVRISAQRLRGGRAQAVLLNSGCANCLTGEAGVRDALRLGREAAHALGVDEQGVLLASTGLIGRRLPADRVTRAIPTLIAQLGRAHHREAARAILTTDRVPKEAACEARLNGRTVRLGGMAKGAGMIAPSLATMLCVLTTDARISAPLLRRMVKHAAAQTFNRITIDGDTSTNDCVFALASGASGVSVRAGTAAAAQFASMVQAVCERLAVAMVADGEGASKTMDVQVVGAKTPRDAEACARQVANSLLVKTMLAGGDPNPGRLAAAVGASGARFDPMRFEVWVGALRVVARDAVLDVSASRLRALLSQPHVAVRVDLHAGRAAARMLTCDLSEGYVRINAGYAT